MRLPLYIANLFSCAVFLAMAPVFSSTKNWCGFYNPTHCYAYFFLVAIALLAFVFSLDRLTDRSALYGIVFAKVFISLSVPLAVYLAGERIG